MTWMEGQDETNNIKIFRNKIKAGSAFLKFSTAHHHPDEFCSKRKKEKNIGIKAKTKQTKAGTNIQL